MKDRDVHVKGTSAGFSQVAGAAGGSHMSDLEFAKYTARQIFDLYDKNRSGIIEENEISQMMTDAYKTLKKPFVPTKSEIGSFVRVLDRNADGKVTISDVEQIVIRFLLGQDYIRYPSQSNNNTPQIIKSKTDTAFTPGIQQHLEQAQKMFARYDKDQDGFLDAHEIPAYMTDTYKAMGMSFTPGLKEVQSFIRMADLDKDGRVGRQDFEHLVIRSLQAREIKLD